MISSTSGEPAAAGSATDCVRELTRKDFQTSQEVRWCPGCGDFAILAQIQKLLPGLGIPRSRFVFVSGIGCSSRFPYYVNTYGFPLAIGVFRQRQSASYDGLLSSQIAEAVAQRGPGNLRRLLNAGTTWEVA